VDDLRTTIGRARTRLQTVPNRRGLFFCFSKPNIGPRCVPKPVVLIVSSNLSNPFRRDHFFVPIISISRNGFFLESFVNYGSYILAYDNCLRNPIFGFVSKPAVVRAGRAAVAGGWKGGDDSGLTIYARCYTVLDFSYRKFGISNLKFHIVFHLAYSAALSGIPLYSLKDHFYIFTRKSI